MKVFDLDGKAELVKRFPYHNDTDIFIHNIGYNNFDFVKPIKWIHRQLGYTIHYVFEGSGTLSLEGKVFRITEKQLFFLPPNKEQMYYPDDGNNWKYAWFYFSGNLADQLGESMGFSIDSPVKTMKDHKHIETLLFDMLSDADHGKMNEYKAKSVFYSIVGAMTGHESSEPINKSCAYEAANFLETNFTRSDFSVETLCSLLYVSHSALCKAFKDEYGMTPLKYLIQLRILHAAKLLSDSSVPVKDVAELSGYKDEIHFMKTFKKYYGITPTEYRQKMQNRKKAKI